MPRIIVALGQTRQGTHYPAGGPRSARWAIRCPDLRRRWVQWAKSSGELWHIPDAVGSCSKALANARFFYFCFARHAASESRSNGNNLRAARIRHLNTCIASLIGCLDPSCFFLFRMSRSHNYLYDLASVTDIWATIRISLAGYTPGHCPQTLILGVHKPRTPHIT